MLTINQYIRPKSLEEAYMLCQKKNNVVLGGMLWLKMQRKTIGTAIDLCELGLDGIEETETQYRIGSMVTLRALEKHDGLAQLTQGAMADAVRDIVGVQFRNVATVGGSVYGRFGFSDVATLLLALEAEVELYHGGAMTLREFMDRPRERDILVRIIVSKEARRICYRAQRNSSTDFPVLTCAVSERAGRIVCAIGARPMPAVVLEDTEECLRDGVTEERAKMFGEQIARRVSFGSNTRGSAEYRRRICAVLVRRAVLALEGE